MSRLTAPKLRKAKEILERYNNELFKTHNLNVTMFEKELKEAWNVGYQEVKGIMIDLSKRGEYVHLAARYMEDGEPGVPLEFKIPLADLYGISHYESKERAKKQKEFWDRAFGK